MSRDKLFTKKEKIAIVRALLEVARADGEVSIDELVYMDRMTQMLGLKPRHVKKAVALTLAECKGIISALSHEAFTYLCVMLRELAMSDGDYDENEYYAAHDLIRSWEVKNQ